MGTRVYNLDENLMCFCGHKWKHHHHDKVFNSDYLSYPLTINGFIAGGCENINTRTSYFSEPDEKAYCECDAFKPSAVNVRRLIKAWNNTQDELRKKKNG